MVGDGERQTNGGRGKRREMNRDDKQGCMVGEGAVGSREEEKQNTNTNMKFLTKAENWNEIKSFLKKFIFQSYNNF